MDSSHSSSLNLGCLRTGAACMQCISRCRGVGWAAMLAALPPLMYDSGVFLIPRTCTQAPTSRRQAADVAAQTSHQDAQRAEPVRVPQKVLLRPVLASAAAVCLASGLRMEQIVDNWLASRKHEIQKLKLRKGWQCLPDIRPPCTFKPFTQSGDNGQANMATKQCHVVLHNGHLSDRQRWWSATTRRQQHGNRQ